MVEIKDLDGLKKVFPLLREMRQQRRTIGPINLIHFLSWWHETIKHSRGCMFISVDSEGRACGVCSCVLAVDPPTGIIYGQTATGYAATGCARPALTLALLRACERWARARGAKVFFAGVVPNDERKTAEVLQALGYKEADTVYAKALGDE